jgi:hypothetical protein
MALGRWTEAVHDFQQAFDMCAPRDSQKALFAEKLKNAKANLSTATSGVRRLTTHMHRLDLHAAEGSNCQAMLLCNLASYLQEK